MPNYRIHSIFFDEYNSWDEWHMIPTGRPSVVTPAMVENTVDVPGMNGSLDLSEALTGYPFYENRSGSFSFMFLNGYGNWVERRDAIIKKLHGKWMKVTLLDDPDYYYEGRITVGDWTTNKDMSSIDINYNFKPYATNRYMTEVVSVEITAGGTETIELDLDGIDTPVTAVFKYTGGDTSNVLSMNFTNTELSYTANNVTIRGYDDYGLVVYDDVKLSNISGNNTVSLTISNSNSSAATLLIGYYKQKL